MPAKVPWGRPPSPPEFLLSPFFLSYLSDRKEDKKTQFLTFSAKETHFPSFLYTRFFTKDASHFLAPRFQVPGDPSLIEEMKWSFVISEKLLLLRHACLQSLLLQSGNMKTHIINVYCIILRFKCVDMRVRPKRTFPFSGEQ